MFPPETEKGSLVKAETPTPTPTTVQCLHLAVLGRDYLCVPKGCVSGAQRAQMSLSSNGRHPAKGSAFPERRDESYQC